MQKQFYPVIGTEKALPFYIIGIGVSCWQFPVSRPEGYDYPQLFVCLEGEGEVTVDGKTVKIMPDSKITPTRAANFLDAFISKHPFFSDCFHHTINKMKKQCHDFL